MFEWFQTLTILQTVFAVFAIGGGVLFVIQVILMLIGGHGDGGADVDVDGSGIDLDGGADVDMDVDAGGDLHGGGTDVDAVHADTDVGFKLLSFQGMTAFFMFFGLVGLSLNKIHGVGSALSMLGGVGAGLVALFVTAKLFQLFRSMQSSGTMNLKNAVGQEARVYLRIRHGSPGKVQVPVQGHLKVFDAVSDGDAEIETGARVKVVRVVAGDTMVVEPVE